MKTRTILQAIARTIADEAESNPEFDAKLRGVLLLNGIDSGILKPTRRRRSPAVFDPVEIAREGESALRHRLETLGIEALKDIVAQYAMDPNKLVMKWKKPERIIDQIVTMSMQRATKGDVFRD